MHNVDMRNVLLNSSYKNNKKPTKKNKKSTGFGYFENLKNTRAFKLKLSDYTILFKILILLFRLVTFVFYTLWFLLKIFAWIMYSIFKKSKLAFFIIVLIFLILIAVLCDYYIYYGKIYPGISVGDIDLSNKTTEEATFLIDQKYSSRLSGNNVVIYVSEEAQKEGLNSEETSGLAEQLSVDQAKKTIRYWKTNSVELEGNMPIFDIVNEAIKSTRGPLNIFKRLGAQFFGLNIKPYAIYSDYAVDTMINRINETVGSPIKNPSVNIEEGKAYAVDGSDGQVIDKNEFLSQLNTAFFQENSENSNFVPNFYTAKQYISYNTADKLAQSINKSLDTKVSFSYKGNTWNFDRDILGKWIKINIENRELPAKQEGCSTSATNTNNYCITANIDSSIAGSDIFSHTKAQVNGSDYSIKFEKSNNNIFVKTTSGIEIPSVSDVISKLNNQWLQNPVVYENNNSNNFIVDSSTDNINIDIVSSTVPESLNLTDAKNLGIVNTISSYTTTYTSGSGTENRNHNIDLAANLINNSICSANGGTWSFNTIAGDCNEERGFKEAGVVLGSTYTKEAGGGICQVATTVFNAVYDAGYAIPSRTNHDLHIASYPAGRDAAISYPLPDLIWRNDENSDVLLQINSTGYSITCNLLGIDPQYNVVTEMGEWEPGEHYASEIVVDNSKELNSKRTQTSGSDGKSIIVIRKVYKSDGTLIREDKFVSKYKPKTEVVVLGPGDEANKLLEEKKARLKKETDNW